MKKVRYWITIAVIVCMGMMLLAGCGEKATAQSLMEEAADQVKKIESFRGNMTMDMEMGVEESGASMSVSMNMEMDIEAVKDPAVYHMTGSVGMDLMDFFMEMESYSVTEDDAVITYTNIGDVWSVDVAEVEADASDMNQLLNLDSFKDNGDLELKDQTETFNGKEVYVITTQITEEAFSESMENVSGAMNENMMGGMDFDDLSMDVEIKIYKDTKLPASISMKMSEGSSASVDQDGTEVGLNELSVTIDVTEYDTIDEIEVPEEALNATNVTSDIESSDELADGYGEYASEDREVTQDDEGNYLLTDYEKTLEVPIAAPEGFELSEYSDSTYLDFAPIETDSELYLSISYYLTSLDEYWTMDDIADSYTSADEMYAEEDGYLNVSMTEIQTMKVGDLDVSYVTLTYEFEGGFWDTQIYAWAALDEGSAVECTIYETAYVEGKGVIDESYVKTAFEAIQK